MSFSFDFDNNDIEEDADGVVGKVVPESKTKRLPDAAPAKLHDLNSLLKKLPSRISYSTIEITGLDGNPVNLPRRELFDVRTQLMAEDMSEHAAVVGLSTDDITPNVYEGGFKTWECSIDLASYVMSTLKTGDGFCEGQHHLIEVGAGTALPTLMIFQHFLGFQDPAWSAIHISLADYNQTVIETTTIPNLLLTWYFARSDPSPPREGDLEITEDLLYSFQKELSDKVISISGVSGAWNDAFCDLLIPFDGLRSQRATQTLFLASETIYSPSSIRHFTKLLTKTLRDAEKAGGQATALVAAKRVYFGVGGGVDEFLKVLVDLGGKAAIAWESVGSGVSRLILEVNT